MFLQYIFIAAIAISFEIPFLPAEARYIQTCFGGLSTLLNPAPASNGACSTPSGSTLPTC